MVLLYHGVVVGVGFIHYSGFLPAVLLASFFSLHRRCTSLGSDPMAVIHSRKLQCTLCWRCDSLFTSSPGSWLCYQGFVSGGFVQCQGFHGTGNGSRCSWLLYPGVTYIRQVYFITFLFGIRLNSFLLVSSDNFLTLECRSRGSSHGVPKYLHNDLR